MGMNNPLTKHTYQFAAEPVHSSNLNEIQDAVVELQKKTFVCVATTPSFSSLPKTFTDAQLTFAGSVNHIETDMIVKPHDYILSNKGVMTNDWTIDTETEGQVTIRGTFSGSSGTTLKLFFSRQ